MSLAPSICPHCGYDLEPDAPIVLGDLDLDPRGEIRWRGKLVPLCASERIVLASLAKAGGRILSAAVLCERIGYGGDAQSDRIGLTLWALRRKLPDVPIRCELRLGWYWQA